MRSTFEIGLPIWKSFQEAEQTLLRALQVDGVTSIHISVNSPGSQSRDFLNLCNIDTRVRVTLQDTNLGLYGNLRFLAMEAESDYFSWLCFDDLPSTDLFTSVESRSKENLPPKALFIPTMGQKHFSTELNWHGPLELWPELELDPSKTSNVFTNFRTHYIYGVWNTKALKKYFPKLNFDWLDAYLLTAVMCRGLATYVDTKTYIVGIVDKFPTRVGSKLRILGWLVFSFSNLFQTKKSFHNFRAYISAAISFSHINHYWNLRERHRNQSSAFSRSL